MLLDEADVFIQERTASEEYEGENWHACNLQTIDDVSFEMQKDFIVDEATVLSDALNGDQLEC